MARPNTAVAALLRDSGRSPAAGSDGPRLERERLLGGELPRALEVRGDADRRNRRVLQRADPGRGRSRTPRSSIVADTPLRHRPPVDARQPRRRRSRPVLTYDQARELMLAARDRRRRGRRLESAPRPRGDGTAASSRTLSSLLLNGALRRAEASALVCGRRRADRARAAPRPDPGVEDHRKPSTKTCGCSWVRLVASDHGTSRAVRLPLRARERSVELRESSRCRSSGPSLSSIRFVHTNGRAAVLCCVETASRIARSRAATLRSTPRRGRVHSPRRMAPADSPGA